MTSKATFSPVFEPNRGFGIYVHWPYCAKICPYCDFNVYVAKPAAYPDLLTAIQRDLAFWRSKTGARQVDTIFFGGGTPSLLSGKEIGGLIEAIDQLWGVKADAEVSLEANPDDAHRFQDISTSGVTRLSLGVQSLRDEALTFLGRNHSVAEALSAVDAARGLFASLSLDFIYALPKQTQEDWQEDLGQITRMGADHLSLYELTIEQRTAFAKAVERGAWRPADEDACADLYDLTQDVMRSAGYPAYEISNHARNNQHQAQHNIIYWKSGDWVGVGPGAHGRLTFDGARYETIAARRPQDYAAAIGASGNGSTTMKTLSHEDIAFERIAMGMRLLEGMPTADFEEPAGRSINKANALQLKEDGLLQMSDTDLSLTPEGQLLADYIARKLAE